jgi:hypothetical protein
MASATSFCPECGTENAAEAVQCTACGRSLDAMAELERAGKVVRGRKLHGVVAATAAGICVGFVVLAWLFGLSLRLHSETTMVFNGENYVDVEMVIANAELWQVFSNLLGFAIAGLVAASVFGGRYLKEVLLGATAGLALQAMIWLVMAGGKLTGDLWIGGEGFVMRGPAPILLGQMLLLMLFSAMLAAFSGFVIRELITGKSECIHCHRGYAIRPKPPARCPHCDIEQTRDGVQWGWVLVFAAGGTLIWALVLAYLREPLGIALQCHASLGGEELTATCDAALANDDFTIFVTERSQTELAFWAIDQWHFIEVGAAWMFTAPVALMFAIKRGARASAAALIPTLWLLASFVVMVVFADLGGNQSGFVFLMRLQVMALVFWGVAGALGLALAYKLRFRSETAYLDEIDG